MTFERILDLAIRYAGRRVDQAKETGDQYEIRFTEAELKDLEKIKRTFRETEVPFDLD